MLYNLPEVKHMTTWIQFSWVILCHYPQTTSPQLSTMAVYSQRSYTHMGEIFYLRFSTVMHSYPLDHLVHIPATKGQVTSKGWYSAFTVLEPEIHSYPWDVLRDSAFTVPLWRLISLLENHKEMMRESSFPNSPCSQYCPSLRAVKGKVSGARCLDSNPAHYFMWLWRKLLKLSGT